MAPTFKQWSAGRPRPAATPPPARQPTVSILKPFNAAPSKFVSDSAAPKPVKPTICQFSSQLNEDTTTINPQNVSVSPYQN
jgi:hypothetical protein